MKILYVIGSPSIGGAELQLLKLVRELSSFHDIYIYFLTAKGPLLRDFQQSGATLLNVGNKNYSKFRVVRELSNQLRTKRFEIIQPILAESVILLFIVTKIVRSQSLLVAGIRGSVFRRGTLMKSIFIKILQRYNYVLCNSYPLRQYCVQEYRIPSEITHVIPNILNTVISSRELPNQTLDSDFVDVVVLANFHDYKGHKYILENLDLFDKNIRFHLVGRNFPERILENYKSVEKVRFYEDITDSSQILIHMDFAIHPSETEGLSNAIIEELSHGLAVVAFDVGGNSDLIHSDENGILITPFDVHKLIQVVNALAANRILREKLSAGALRSVSKFSVNSVVPQYLEFYKRILNHT